MSPHRYRTLPFTLSRTQFRRYLDPSRSGKTRLSLGEIWSIQRRRHTQTRLLLRRLREDRIHRLDNCVMDQTGAMNAICFVGKEDVFAENLRERSQALWGGNCNVLSPEGSCPLFGIQMGANVPGCWKNCHSMWAISCIICNKRTQVCSFFIEGIGDNSGWYAIA